MSFVPAGQIIGDAHKVRSVELSRSPQLPDGEYSFIDMYCTDLQCDCRKTMIRVMHNGRYVSLINYGWEEPEYYKKWMFGDETADLMQMSGASIDMNSPDLVNRNGVLGLFRALLNDQWKEMFKRNYRLTREPLAKSSK